jgi:hypothetical protein
MDEFKSNVPGAFVQKISRKTVYLTLLSVLAAATIAGLLLAPTFNGTATVSAQKQKAEAQDLDREMLAAALNFKSASSFTVYAERGVSAGAVRGEVFDGSDVAFRGSKVKSDADEAMNYINQLPCTDVGEGDLSGRSFGPGIYCLTAARLSGQMTLDAGGDQGAMFLFKVKGDFSADAGSSIALAGDAMAGNAYFVANRTTIGGDASFMGNVISKGDIIIGSGTKVNGKVLSLGGSVSAREAELGGTDGTLQICKTVAAGSGLETSIFQFTISGSVFSAANPLQVPANQCSQPFDVAAGNQVITELGTRLFINQAGSALGGFALSSVTVTTNLGTSSLGAVNLPLQTANVTIAAGGAATMMSLRFTNVPATTGVVEICKAPGLDADVGFPGGASGIFRFTVEGVFAQPGGTVLQIFQAPLGGCSGPITVVLPTAAINQATFNVLVSELGPGQGGAGGPTGFMLEAIASDPAGRLCTDARLGGLSLLLNARLNANGTVTAGANPGGGVGCFVLIGVPPAGPGGTANASNETRAIFFNRSNPGIVKVCKIAGPNFNPARPNLFRFEVRGTDQNGNPIIRFVDVLAGPQSQGGFCQIVPVEGFVPGTVQLFRIGTNVLVRELGISPNNINPVPAGQILVSNITVSANTAFATAPVTVGGITTNPNPDLTPNAAGAGGAPDADIARAVAAARREEIVFTFTNITFQPTVLKICKIGSTVLGQTFNFSVQVVDPTGFITPALRPPVAVSAVAGEAANGGFCTVVDGSGQVGGAFNIGSTVTITEAGTAGVRVIAVGSTSGTPVTNPALPGPVGGAFTATAGGLVAGTNVVTFTNSTGTAARAVRFDFDGDSKADPSTFSPSNFEWRYASSANGGSVKSFPFGATGDILVPGDYDGDGRYDEAVFRPSNGRWYIHGTTGIYELHDWGQSGDVPQAGDFDGDGRFDLVVYRPSNGVWYVKSSSAGFNIFQFGISTDKPVAADYDGDGKTDAAVFRNGRWFIAGSSAGFGVYDFGIATDKPVPADYDGDGKADVAVFRSGTWFYLGSRGTYNVIQHGQASDIAVPADYDGDGKADLAVFRGSEGKWFIRRSSQTDAGGDMTTVSFGSGSDVALPSL